MAGIHVDVSSPRSPCRRPILALCAACLTACGGGSATTSGTGGSSTANGGSATTPDVGTLVSRASKLKINSLAFTLNTAVPATAGTPAQNVVASASMQLHPTLAGSFVFTVAGMTVNERIVGNSIYVKTPALAARDGGRPWLAVDLNAASSASGIDLSALLKTATSADPTNTLRLLAARKVFHETGTSTIRGQRVIVLSGAFTPATLTAPGLNPKLLAQIKSKLAQLGATREDIVSYLSETGEPVRIVTTLTTATHGAITSTVDISAVNLPINVSAPAASQTITLAELKKLGR